MSGGDARAEGAAADRGTSARTEAARLLRQRVEMGEADLFLDGLTRNEAYALVASGTAAADAGSAGIHSAAQRERPSGRPSGAAARLGSAEAAVGAGIRERDGRASADPAGALPSSYDDLRTYALACSRCRLADGRTQVVFSDGALDARLMVVGEAPGANEDETGLPFVGAAGKFLDLLLATVGLSRRESVYICNVIKCRPPGNRNPMPDEIEACSPYLRRQIELIRPEAVLAVGSFAAQLLTGKEKAPLGRMRGDVHGYEGVPLVVTYHPAALLRNPKWTRAFWEDLQLLRAVLDGA